MSKHAHTYAAVYDNDREYDGRIPRHRRDGRFVDTDNGQQPDAYTPPECIAFVPSWPTPTTFEFAECWS